MFPPDFPAVAEFTTAGGIRVRRQAVPVPEGAAAMEALAARLDGSRGLMLACDVDAAPRYLRRAAGFADPPLVLTGSGRSFAVEALNPRGAVLLPVMARAVAALPDVADLEAEAGRVAGRILAADGPASEEERIRQPSLFSVVRAVLGVLATGEDHHLGLWGAFGYDLVHQVEPVRLRLPRGDGRRDLVLYLPDELLVWDGRSGRTWRLAYDFAAGDASTAGLERSGAESRFVPDPAFQSEDDHPPGAYADTVRAALDAFRRGDLFEAVPSQGFARPCRSAPSTLFRRLRRTNPAPFGALVNLGGGEILVSASPEMFVRSDGMRIETAPISGTIRRGRDAVEDAGQVLALLNSGKEAAELAMCTDVDRNDKARVCRPGSVRIVGRRQIETTSRLIHTVDHVEGELRPGLDVLDAMLAHAWAVTVTGAPKRGAMQFIEDHEASPRAWYGGAFGALFADGGADTALTLRTIRLAGGRAEVRVGATLLMDSVPDDEEAETRLKAAALLAVLEADAAPPAVPAAAAARPGDGRRVVVVDHEDSFVHTLADYLRQSGAEVVVVRRKQAAAAMARLAPDLVVLSPGPGRPPDFAVGETIALALARGAALFGVCLGLQGIAEHFGGTLAVGPACHGKASWIEVAGDGGRLLAGLPRRFQAGRYHSLHAVADSLPAELQVTARADGLVMALEHRHLPVAAVQFHPESLLTLADGIGHRLVANVMARLRP